LILLPGGFTNQLQNGFGSSNVTALQPIPAKITLPITKRYYQDNLIRKGGELKEKVIYVPYCYPSISRKEELEA